MTAADVGGLAARIRASATAFARAHPFPHVVLDGALPAALLDTVAEEFTWPGVAWKAYHHVNEKKLVASDLATMGPASRRLIEALHAPAIRAALASMAGAADLLTDPDLDGAGLQQTRAGGFLNVHVDHLSHIKRRTWSRQLNLLVFLNRDWPPAYGGDLELWDAGVTRCMSAIPPLFNRCVIFRTLPVALHGVPGGVTCPPDRTRKSLALYYYRDEGRPCALAPTRYVPRPGDGPLRRALIHADRWLLGAYSAVKRYTPIDDALISRILRHF